MDEQTITHLGIGGLFALAILKIVFDFLKGQRNNKNGGSPVTKAEFEKHKGAVQYKDNCNEIVKRFDQNYLSQEKRFNRIDDHLGSIKTLIKNGS